jgi:hypothetical protein
MTTTGRSKTTGMIIASYVVSGLLSLMLLGYGALRNDVAVSAVGVLGLIVVGAAAPFSFTGRKDPRSEMLILLRDINHSIKQLTEQQALSDDARRVLHRDRERELLRGAIEEDMRREDWEAAMVLVHELADRFGYRNDAEEFRTRIDAERAEHLEHDVASAVASLDGLITQRRWEDARAEAERIARLYPDSRRAQGLDGRVDRAFDQYRSDVEHRFLQAARNEQIDEAMRLLKELDLYLSAEDAEPYKEVARGVIGKARDNLGVQFKLAVRDHQYRRATQIGQQIIEQFPNTRMADEVRSMLNGLHQRATATESA